MPFTVYSPNEFIRIGNDEDYLIVRRADVLSIRVFKDEDAPAETRVEFRDTSENGWDSQYLPGIIPPAQLLVLLNGTEPTTPPPDARRELVIIRVVRGTTRNSNSPLWRCYDEDGEQVNVFKHDDPDKNNWRIVEAAGWGSKFDAMHDGDEIIFDPYSVTPPRMIIKHDGKWNTLVAMPPRRFDRLGSLDDDQDDDGPPPISADEQEQRRHEADLNSTTDEAHQLRQQLVATEQRATEAEAKAKLLRDILDRRFGRKSPPDTGIIDDWMVDSSLDPDI